MHKSRPTSSTIYSLTKNFKEYPNGLLARKVVTHATTHGTIIEESKFTHAEVLRLMWEKQAKVSEGPSDWKECIHNLSEVVQGEENRKVFKKTKTNMLVIGNRMPEVFRKLIDMPKMTKRKIL